LISTGTRVEIASSFAIGKASHERIAILNVCVFIFFHAFVCVSSRQCEGAQSWPGSPDGEKSGLPLDYIEEVTPAHLEHLGWTRVVSKDA
jgi:hypothetical protein